MRARLLGVVAAGALLLSQPLAWAAPQGGSVVAGSAAISRPNALTTQVLQASDKAILNWEAFGIDAGELVKFVQPDTTAVALNRVTGAGSSRLLGQLQANGRIFLLNPNGIVFGPHAEVDVAGLLATTLDVPDADFLAGRIEFGQKPGAAAASLLNRGRIQIADNGFAFLVAPGVRNEGLIVATLGKVVLGGGTRLSLDLSGDGLLSYEVGGTVLEQLRAPGGQPLNAAVSNTGRVKADGGAIVLTADAARQIVSSVINQEGLLQAKSPAGAAGSVRLEGRGEGAVRHTGAIEVSGVRPAATGGTAIVTGEEVLVGGSIDASGAAGGGTISVGGGPRGGDAALRNAARTTVTGPAVLRADATNAGPGGTISVWADDATTFAGRLSAIGGARGGRGGLAEISAGGIVTLAGLADRVDLSAPAGAAGTLLLDPNDINVIPGAGGPITNPANANVLFDRDVSAFLRAGGGNVSLDMGAFFGLLNRDRALGLLPTDLRYPWWLLWLEPPTEQTFQPLQTLPPELPEPPPVNAEAGTEAAAATDGEAGGADPGAPVSSGPQASAPTASSASPVDAAETATQ